MEKDDDRRPPKRSEGDVERRQSMVGGEEKGYCMCVHESDLRVCVNNVDNIKPKHVLYALF